MKQLRSILAVLLIVVSPYVAASKEDCTFDQAAVAKELSNVASRNPGAAFASEEQTFTWRLPSGETVSVGHGGCEDLGTTVKVTFEPESNPTKDQAVARLLKAVSQYWSRQHAQGVRAAWQKRVFEQYSASDNEVEYTFPKAAYFPFGFTLTFSPTSVSLGWVEA